MKNPHFTYVHSIGRWLAVVVGVIIMLSPLYWAAVTSVKPTEDILSYPPSLIPLSVTIDHYLNVLVDDNFSHYITNSLFIAFCTVVVVLIVSIPAGYAASRFVFRGKMLILFVILAGMGIGHVVTILPFYLLGVKTGLLDTYILLILVYSVYMVPLATWMMRGYFASIPRAIDDAAIVDGCSRLGALVFVMVPLVRPGIAAISIVTFLHSWNEFILAVSLTVSEDMRTMPVALYRFMTTYGVDWGGVTAASILSLIPIIVIFSVLQKQFIYGVTGGAMGGQ